MSNEELYSLMYPDIKPEERRRWLFCSEQCVNYFDRCIVKQKKGDCKNV